MTEKTTITKISDTSKNTISERVKIWCDKMQALSAVRSLCGWQLRCGHREIYQRVPEWREQVLYLFLKREKDKAFNFTCTNSKRNAVNALVCTNLKVLRSLKRQLHLVLALLTFEAKSYLLGRLGLNSKGKHA